jgi:voltage-gated potassium channel
MTGGREAAGRKRVRRLRHRTYEVLEQAMPGDRLAQYVHAFLMFVIVLSVAAVVLESVPSLQEAFEPEFLAVEILTIMIFTVEYALRVWAAVDYPPFRHMPAWQARLRFAVTGGAIIDLLTILPFYLSLFLEGDLRVFIVFRLLRFLKLARYSPGVRSLYEAIYEERRALAACLVILSGLVIASASVMYLVERHAQPDKFGTIPDAMWWAVITLATVGYGDVVPITPLGKVVASITALMGLVMIALPVGIVATAFSEVIHRRDFVVTWGMIARVPLFADLGAEEVAQIMRLLRSQMVEGGEIIVRRGDLGHSMYFIASGRVEIELSDGRHAYLGDGQFFGEMAVLKSARRSATVRALQRTQLLVLDARDLRMLMASRPDIGTRVHEVAQARAEELRKAASAEAALTPGDGTQAEAAEEAGVVVGTPAAHPRKVRQAHADPILEPGDRGQAEAFPDLDLPRVEPEEEEVDEAPPRPDRDPPRKRR